MASVLFVILRLSGLVDTKMDWVLLCGLIAIDTIGVTNLVGMLKKR